MWRDVTVVLLVSLSCLVTANALLLHQYITLCCDDGANYANAMGTCTDVDKNQTLSMELQEDEDIEDCKITMRSCCHNELKGKFCFDGLGHRGYVGSCDGIKENTCTGSAEKTCCECCELGLRAYSENAPCDGLDLGLECDYAFRECCQSASEVNDRDECSIAIENGHTLCTYKCINLIGTYACECPDGFKLASSDNMTCVRDRLDITNPCDDSFCEHICQPYGNTYVCTCNGGFELMSDGFSCQEPTSTSLACMFADCEYGCRPIGTSSHECYCDQGYDLDTDRSTCIDTDECEVVAEICPHGHICTNTEGSYVCHAMACPTGMSFSQDSSRCEDINECLEDTLCPLHKLCQNYRGGFYCQATLCNEGQFVDKNTGECGDIDECASGSHDCPDGFRCDNSPGSFRCIRISPCGTGYTINANLQTCEDIDECRLDTDNCPPEFYCQNTVGSYKCKRCRQGFKADANDGCALDIDECEEQTHNCPFGQVCTNTYGSFSCAPTCPEGTQYDDVYRECKDIDECLLGLDHCTRNQVCENIDGSFQCTCRTGLELNQFTRDCDDIDECERRTHNCRINEQCFNFEGSFTCQQRCQLNYRYNASVGCVDINECEQEQYPCRGNSECVNLPGSFRCQQCPRGQIANLELRICEDIDECNFQGPNCMGGCKNTFGSYMCTCPSGYELVNRYNCRNIDECLRNTHNCSSQSACFDTRGGFKCKYIQCPQYYHKEINGGEVRCEKVSLCPNNDLNCVNERVKMITYNKIALPSLSRDLTNPLELLKLQIGDLSYNQEKGLRFELTQGNELGLFSVFKTSRRDFRWAGTPRYIAVGTLNLMRSMVGPYETDLRLEMKLFNLDNQLLSITAAIFSIDIGVHPF